MTIHKRNNTKRNLTLDDFCVCVCVCVCVCSVEVLFSEIKFCKVYFIPKFQPNLANQSLSLEGTAKSDSHGDCIALTSPNLTPPLFVIGLFC